jgi:cyclic beta-1,2-glucan synthetase
MGRGGWTWYTGSAAWMYRTIVESVLGLTLERGHALVLRPRIPDAWPSYRMRYQLGDGTTYVIAVENPHRRAGSMVSASCDGREVAIEDGGVRVAVAHDGGTHDLRVTLG